MLKNIMCGNKKHKLLFINHWAQRLGGAELSLLDIMNEAVKKSDVFLVCTENGILIQKAADAGVNCMVIQCDKNIEKMRREHLITSLFGNWRALRSYFQFLWQLWKYVAKLKPDIIHANIPKSHMALSLLALSGYHGISIFHLREIFHSQSFTAMLYRLLIPRNKSHIIAISDAVREALPQRLKKQALLLYNGVKVADEFHEKRIGKERKFLYIGRIVPWKGCHFLMDAFFRMYQQLGDASGSLDLVGDTLYWDQSYRNELHDRINKLNMTTRIRIFSHTDKPDDIYSSHDILCMASDKEPFGRVAVEAMGCGLPVISFDSGGISEIVKHGTSGFLIKQNDIEDFAAAMGMFVKNPSLIESMGKAGYEFVKENFNRENNIPNILHFMINLSEQSR